MWGERIPLSPSRPSPWEDDALCRIRRDARRSSGELLPTSSASHHLLSPVQCPSGLLPHFVSHLSLSPNVSHDPRTISLSSRPTVACAAWGASKDADQWNPRLVCRGVPPSLVSYAREQAVELTASICCHQPYPRSVHGLNKLLSASWS